jgi:hypothetical protein
MSLETAIAALVTIMDSVVGLRVYDDPPESLSEFPAAMVYPLRGDMEIPSWGMAKSLHTLALDIYHARTTLPQAVADTKQWPGVVLGLLHDYPTLNSTVDAIVWPVSYRVRPMQYNQAMHFGVRFEITVKIMEAMT